MAPKQKIPTRLSRNIHRLHVAAESPVKLQKALLRQLDIDFVACLCDCIDNIKDKTIKLSKKQWKKLKPYSNILNKLAAPTTSFKTKRRILIQQKGGFLPYIISPVLYMLAELATQYIKG